MDRIAIVSDIHSNRHALEAVAERLYQLACDAVFCLGDVVGYGAHPVTCLQWAKGHCAGVVQGNHDAVVAGTHGAARFNEYSLAAAAHNRALLAPGDRNWLGGLSISLEPEPGLLLVHGAPGDRDRYLLYLGDLHETAAWLLDSLGPGICFFGHTHIPVVFDGLGFVPLAEAPIPVLPGARMLINPGSVGQPRDGDSRAAFCIWDRARGVVQFERVAYDARGACQDILQAGLPAILGERLLIGR